MSHRPSTFCPLPWNHLATQTNGDVRICCNTGRGPERGLLRNEDGTVINLGRDRLMSARNAPLAKSVRLSMLNGERHPECVRCWSEEDSGLRSRRQDENEVWGDWQSLVAATAPDGSIADDCKPAYYDLRFGNFCNLKCRMCGPTDSSAWYEDWVELTGKDVFHDNRHPVKLERNARGRWADPVGSYDWYDNKQFWADIEANRDGIKHVYIIGGEPLLITAHYDFLEQCVASGHSSSMILQYNTNLTNLQKRALDIWSHFKEIRIGVSLDAVGAVNDYIRFPSKWTALEKNLFRLEDAMGDNAKLWLTPSIGAYNILYLGDLIKWRAQADFKRFNDYRSTKRAIFNPHPITAPSRLSFSIFPQDVKEAIANRLAEVVPWMESFLLDKPEKQRDRMMADTLKIVHGYTDMMFKTDLTDQLGEFWDFTRRMDAIRGENIEKSLPELYSLIAHTEAK